MAPRFAFHASKFRNIECKQLPREQSYDGLQVTTALVEGNALAATVDKFAFAHQMDGGGAVQVKSLSETGKGAPITPPLIRAHQSRVNTLEFSPFDANLLATGSADATVKLWKLPENGPLQEDLRTPVVTFASEARSSVGGVRFHPSAQGVVAFYAHKELLIGDIESQATRFQLFKDDGALGDNLCSMTWNYDGSMLLTASLDKQVRLVDPRVVDGEVLQTEAHTGRRQSSVVWCGRLEHFVTTGSDRMQERELKLWDPRNLSSHVHRQRLDSSIGQLYPFYDDDVNLLYLLGKGDRSVRSFEVDFGRGSGTIQALDHSVLANMTFAAAMLPKQACDTASCEVARVLNLSSSGGGLCDVLSFQVPRKDAVHTFQSDLYPDTKAFKSALSSEEWQSGTNADPLLEKVSPTSAKSSTAPRETGASSVFDVSQWKLPAATPTPSNGNKPAATTTWGSAWSATSPASSTTTSTTAAPSSTAAPPPAPSGWGTSTSSWSAASTSAKPVQAVPTWKAAASVPSQPPQWQTTVAAAVSAENAPGNSATTATAPGNADVDAGNAAAAEEETPDMLSDKARRLGSKYGHKLKYIKGKQATRNELFHFGDKSVASSTIASPIIKANSKFWAVPIMGAGGPVMVNALSATGRASTETSILNGHKYAVADMDFSPFKEDILATGGGDSVIQLWSVSEDASSSSTPVPMQTLKGHTKGLRAVKFHPTASNVLCSAAQDLTLRLWDVEHGQEQMSLVGKFEDMVWSMAFNFDGSLLATSSRERIVRIFDPRSQSHPLVAMGCGHDSAKPQFVTWIDDSKLVTVGVNARNEKQILFWDPKNLLEPISSPVTIETSASSVIHYPFYDESSRLLFLVGMGDRHVQSYEIDPISATAHANLPFAYSGQDPISGAVLLPKSLCDVRNVEIDRLLLLTPNVVDRVSFSLPRTEKLREFFQDDVYGPTRTPRASLTASQWFAGETVAPVYESLRPNDMVPLSQKPKEVVQARPKTLDFQDRIRKEDEEKRVKAEQFERLNALASQPSLHSVTKGVTSNAKTAAAHDSDSDDDWDD